MTTPPPSSAGDHGPDGTAPQASLPARMQEKLAADIPYGIVVAAAWSWRVLLIIVMTAVAVWLLSHVSLLIIPILIAALLATLLQPAHRLLLKLKFPPVLSSLTLTVLLVLVVVALFTLAGQQLAAGFATMQASVSAGVRDFIALIESWGLRSNGWTIATAQ